MKLNASASWTHTPAGTVTATPYNIIYFDLPLSSSLFLMSLSLRSFGLVKPCSFLRTLAAFLRDALVRAIAWQNSCTDVAIFSSEHAACVASGTIHNTASYSSSWAASLGHPMSRSNFCRASLCLGHRSNTCSSFSIAVPQCGQACLPCCWLPMP